MADTPTTTLLVVLAVALARAIEWLAKAVHKSYERPKNGNGKHIAGLQSGQLSPEEWEGRMRKMHEESEERIMEDMRSLMDSRSEKVRQIVREELRNL